MDLTKLLLTFDGRIGRQEFWIGWAILFAAGIVSTFIPFIGWIIGLALIYPKICIYAKRLHDMGKTGWLQVIPYAVYFVAFLVAIVTAGPAIITMAMSGDTSALQSTLAGLGVALFVIFGSCVVAFAFWLWVGISATQPGENRFGPAPGAASAEETFS